MSSMVLKAFLSQTPEEEREALLRFLPPSEVALLNDLPAFEEGAAFIEEEPSQALEQIHWSWILPTIETFSPREQKWFLSALSRSMQEPLIEALAIEEPLEEASDIAKSYFQEYLLSSLVSRKEKQLPAPFFPASPLNALLALTKRELMHRIDDLALYDLAFELRQIVETKILKKLYSFLSEEQKGLLKKISVAHPEPSFPRLGLERWDGTEEALRSLLHRRGLTRLGTALAGQHPDLVWALCHHLDIGRGSRLFKQYEKETESELSALIVQQIEELLSLRP
jgi:hypothetical protein